MRFDEEIHTSAWLPLNSLELSNADIIPRGRPHRGLEEALNRHLPRLDTEYLVLEVGCELGGSTRFFLDFLPRSSIVCIDPWPAGYKLPEDLTESEPDLKDRESLYEMFLYFCRAYRTRILPIRKFSAEGVVDTFRMMLVPDIIYIDGDHRYLGTLNDLILMHNLFPDALIIGDDWNFSSTSAVYKGIERSVRKAAVDFADHFGLEVHSYKNTYVIPPAKDAEQRALNYTVGGGRSVRR
jgi:hypothetical protein